MLGSQSTSEDVRRLFVIGEGFLITLRLVTPPEATPFGDTQGPHVRRGLLKTVSVLDVEHTFPYSDSVY